MDRINHLFQKILVGSIASCLYFLPVNAQDTIQVYKPLLHKLSADFRPEYVFQTNDFLRGENDHHACIDQAYAFHLSYSFQYDEASTIGRIYGNPYQGIGIGSYTFNNTAEMGNPIAFYVFQGARLLQFTKRIHLNYEWNFGVSSGWKPYNSITNPNNGGVGTALNAYINLGLYVNYSVTQHIDLITGFTLSHFSNGNTKYPNAGINNGGFRLGIAYYFNRTEEQINGAQDKACIPPFHRHMTYDLMMFGSWRRKGVPFEDRFLADPIHYAVAGFSFVPMYNFCYRFRAGIGIDGVYDASSNVTAEELTVELHRTKNDDSSIDLNQFLFHQAPFNRQVALGASLRAEYVMPFFSINVGVGYNFLYAKGDTRGSYQQLALKIKLFKGSYLNIGYNLHNFNIPNFLMLGIGYRFNHNR